MSQNTPDPISECIFKNFLGDIPSVPPKTGILCIPVLFSQNNSYIATIIFFSVIINLYIIVFTIYRHTTQTRKKEDSVVVKRIAT